jgi:phage shock protein E
MLFAQSQRNELTAIEFKKMVDENSTVVILDVRTDDEVKDGVIGKPIHIDYFRKDFDQKIKVLDKSKTYLVYCASGFRSGEAVKLMRSDGFNNAYNLKDGIQAWKKQKLPLQK